MQNFANSKDLINIIERILVIGLSEEDISIFTIIKKILYLKTMKLNLRF